ncbi:dihydrolipoyl dehydrogenase family protein [Blastochloris tepida]|uniref:Mercuric reductase n=1 Tax=Blastochloris tepida TaxID=2233851 RepID=A0A348G3S5_9HYPH|nr:FAD-dependent oxidoreductase [Blastochloris tepida]BBF94208.1 mercuric reductase [Blastochloris tepida]
MATRLTPDLCVIGAGSGGLSVAAAAAGFGVPVVLVERHAMGGDCLNTGCVPSKALLAAAKRAQAIRTAGTFGIAAGEPAVDFRAVMAHVRTVQASIAPNDSEERFTALGVTVIRAGARFVGADIVAAGETEIAARRFVIATGSSPALPPIAGLSDTPHLTTDTIWSLDVLPRHLAIIGGGPVGCELAQAFRRLGSAVTVLETARPLAGHAADCAEVALAALGREGVEIRSPVSVAAVRRVADGVEIEVEEAGRRFAFEASHLLVAAGRRPNVEGLGLDQAGIAHSPRGIQVDAGLRTTNRRVYAIGDVIGGAMFTHAAGWQAGLVVRSALFRLPVNYDPDIIPRVTFTDPEVAQVGLDEANAQSRHRGVRVVRVPFSASDRAEAERDTAGFLKVVTTARGRILGVEIVGRDAGEMIGAWALAVAQRANIRSFAALIAPYPTRAEIARRAAIAFFAPRLTGRLVKGIIRVLQGLG